MYPSYYVIPAVDLTTTKKQQSSKTPESYKTNRPTDSFTFYLLCIPYKIYSYWNRVGQNSRDYGCYVIFLHPFKNIIAFMYAKDILGKKNDRNFHTNTIHVQDFNNKLTYHEIIGNIYSHI